MDPSNQFRLAENAIVEGYRLTLYDEIGSTNAEAMRSALADDRGRGWFVARAQTQGRGRHGRQWVSPRGNLHASLLLIDEVPVHLAPQLGFVAGVALASALRECLGDDPRLRLKWPNDILHEGAKLAGILLESAKLADGRSASVVGIGVNCAAFPRDLAYRATALAEIGATHAAAESLFLYLSGELARGLSLFARGDGFAMIRAEWLTWAAGLGAPIRVDTPAGVVSGVFRTIDAGGRLMVENEGVITTIDAGDVWLADSGMLA